MPSINSVSHSRTNGSAASLTFAHVSDGNQLVVLVRQSGTPNVSYTATYDGVSMELAINHMQQLNITNYRRWLLFTLPSPSVGAASVIITPSSSKDFVACSFNIEDAEPITSALLTFHHSGTSSAPSAPIVAPEGSLAVSFIVSAEALQVFSTAENAHYEDDGFSGTNLRSALASRASTPGSYDTMNWTLDISSVWACWVVAFRSASYVAPSFVRASRDIRYTTNRSYVAPLGAGPTVLSPGAAWDWSPWVTVFTESVDCVISALQLSGTTAITAPSNYLYYQVQVGVSGDAWEPLGNFGDTILDTTPVTVHGLFQIAFPLGSVPAGSPVGLRMRRVGYQLSADEQGSLFGLGDHASAGSSGVTSFGFRVRYLKLPLSGHLPTIVGPSDVIPATREASGWDDTILMGRSSDAASYTYSSCYVVWEEAPADLYLLAQRPSRITQERVIVELYGDGHLIDRYPSRHLLGNRSYTPLYSPLAVDEGVFVAVRYIGSDIGNPVGSATAGMQQAFAWAPR